LRFDEDYQMPLSPVDRFLKEYSKRLDDREAAIIIGAGLSIPAGLKNWVELLRDVADELSLDIDKETDLVALAQFHFNKHKVRTRLNQLLVDEYGKDVPVTENHQLIANLPIETVWTTNYDCLIEKAFREAGKKCEAKITPANFSTTIRGKDATVYKMHGDVSQPQDAVLMKEDYELYNHEKPGGINREVYTNALKGDLVSNTFLFLGFSFTDPNIDYILSRIRALMGHNPRQHYCIMKRPNKPADSSGEDQANYDYEMRRLELRTGDLRRYGIEAVMVDDYAEITDILRALNKLAHRNNVFVSGSANDYSPFDQSRVENLLRMIGQALIKDGLNLVSGLGLGVGGTVLLGALEQVYGASDAAMSDRVVMRPFPQLAPADPQRAHLYTRYRKDMIANVGYVVFVCGNKLNVTTGATEPSPGVFEEFSIAKQLGKYPIPLGATGSASKSIWDEVIASPAQFYGYIDVTKYLQILGDASKTNDEWVSAILSIIKRTSNK
jgi:hypothetical protein